MLTSGEVQQLLEARGQNLAELSAAPLDAVVPGIPDSPHLYGIPGGSGQHLHNATSRLSAQVFREPYAFLHLPWTFCSLV